jgi:RHS repeat-associated protein
LGNSRLMVADKNDDGYIQASDSDPGGSPGYTEILQENHYYPFGLNMEGPWHVPVEPEDRVNRYQYNGKELNEDIGLGWSDYGARWYDAAVGRFTGVDPLAEFTPNHSTYAYTFNNPIAFFDPSGMMGEEVGADGLTNDQWLESSRPNANHNLVNRYRKANRAEETERASGENKKKDPDYPTPEELSQRFGESFINLFLKSLYKTFNYEFDIPTEEVAYQIIGFISDFKFFRLKDKKNMYKLKLMHLYVSGYAWGSPPPTSGSLQLDWNSDAGGDPRARTRGIQFLYGLSIKGSRGTTINPGVYNSAYDNRGALFWDGEYPTYTSPIFLNGNTTGFIGLNIWLEIVPWR